MELVTTICKKTLRFSMVSWYNKFICNYLMELHSQITEDFNMSFQTLLPNQAMVQALAQQDITEPTEIQQQVIPLLLAGRDVIGQSYTGSGKTLPCQPVGIDFFHPSARRPKQPAQPLPPVHG